MFLFFKKKYTHRAKLEMELLKSIQNNIEEYYESMFDNIQYGILSKEDIEYLSIMNISLSDIQNFYINKKLIDDKFEHPDLGVNDFDKICPTCNKTCNDCPGHYATIDLPFHIVNPIFYNDLICILNCICLSCSRLLIGCKEILSIIMKLPKNQRLKEIALKSKGLHCTRKVSEITDNENIKECPKIFSEFSFRKNEMGNIKTIKIKFLPNSKIFSDVNCDVIYKILEAIPEEDVKIMGLGKNHPKNLLMDKILVIPPKTRPTISDGSKIYADGLTKAYKEIINTISTYLISDSKKSDNRAVKDIDKLNIDEFQILKDIYQSSHDFSLKIPILNAVSNLINSSVNLGRTSVKTTTSSSFAKKLNGKYGLIRRYMMGKRVNHTGRTVVGPSPDFAVNEIGVPKFIAMNSSIRVHVNDINYDEIMKLYRDKKIKSVIKTNGKQKDMRFIIDNEKQNFEKGDIIERELMNGDYVLANRNPTIHKQGMMGLKTRIVDENIFRLNLALTTPLNADFDGDDLNIFIPQTIHAMAELATFASAEGSYGDSQSSKLMVGLVFDGVTGSFNITQDYVFLEEYLFHNIVFECDMNDEYIKMKNYNFGHGFIKTKKKLQNCIDIVFEKLYIYLGQKISIDNMKIIKNNIIIFEKNIEKLDIEYSDDEKIFNEEFLNQYQIVFNENFEKNNMLNQLIYIYFTCYNDDTYNNLMDCFIHMEFNDIIIKNKIYMSNNENEFLNLFIKKISFYYNLKNNIIEQETIDNHQHYFDLCLKNGVDYLSGKAFYSLLFPHDLFYEKEKQQKTELDKLMFNVKIKNGILYQGSLNKEHVGTSPNSIVHILFLYKDYSVVTEFLTYAQRMINHWFGHVGFSLGYDDCILPESVKNRIDKSIQDIRSNAIYQQLNIQVNSESQKEEKIIQILQEIRLLNDEVIKELPITSPLLVMAELAKAKGKGANLVQIMASVGQQYYKSCRINNDSPYFKRDDPDPLAKGLCLSSFIDGMTPSEFVYHMYSSREGLTDSALKTADCGSEHHNLTKALEILNVNEDRTIRNVSGRIVQFTYGEDGFDAEQLHSIKATNQQATFVDVNLLAKTFNSIHGC